MVLLHSWYGIFCDGQWYQKNSGVDEVIAASAKQGTGVDEVKQWLLGHLPYGPAYYPKVCRIMWPRKNWCPIWGFFVAWGLHFHSKARSQVGYVFFLKLAWLRIQWSVPQAASSYMRQIIEKLRVLHDLSLLSYNAFASFRQKWVWF
jgi:hypothetical protein